MAPGYSPMVVSSRENCTWGRDVPLSLKDYVATAMVELWQILRDAVESGAVGNPTWPMADILPVTSNVAANVRQSWPPDGQFGWSPHPWSSSELLPKN